MPIHNFTIDDGSATIAYEPRENWIDSDPTYANLSDYFSGSFHASQRSGAKATFSFNGTGVYIYGTKRRDHGPYSVVVNGTTFHGDGRPAGDDESPAVLYSKSNLPYGLHTVVLTNEGSASFLDLDYVDITTGDGNSSTVVMDQTLDDADKAFTYDSHWGPGPPKLAGNETKHATNVPHAQANITFNGNAIRVCSTSGRKHGMFSVSLDGAPSIAYNASAPTNRQRTLLYSLDGLPDGNHVLTMENLSNDTQHWFALDQVIVSNYVANTSEPSMSWTGTPAGASKSSHIGAIAGAVIGGLVGLGLLFVLGWVFWRRGYRMNRRNRFFKFDIDDETGGSRMHQAEQSFHHSTPESVSGAGHLDTTPMSSVTVPLPATSLTLHSHDLPPSYNVVSPSTSLRTTVIGDGKGKEVVLTYET